MIFIAHRGNTEGKNPLLENNPLYIEQALKKKCDVEVDVWYDGSWYLGHDKKMWGVTRKWLRDHSYGCWYHAKNFEALNRMMDDGIIKEVFWHNDDKFTITKGGYIWTRPNNDFSKKSIVYLNEGDLTIYQCHGICSDDVLLRK